ncbi:hypothetical protein EV356DRAFT_573248 [Viridothelium virens]|uniref:Uncharacterized protein n=1 Tax=Viridothelium virens TaxID=1048519 RepID=A0A6A6HL20_VIRVR|nr:hypothetical protein EV356DRAFT_573248 [Viridothelium virens]
MNQFFGSILTVLYYIGLPFWLPATWLLRALKPLYYFLAFLALPFIYLSRFIAYLVTWPFLFLARFETLYIYVGVASLVGIVTGCLVYGVLQILSSVLRLSSDELEPEVPKRTVASYRAARRKRKGKNSKDALMSPVYLSRSEKESNTQLGLLSQTILEEDDSDF